MQNADPRAVTLLGAPSDANSSFLRGAAAAPREIRAALHSPSANLWTETGIDLGVEGVLRDAGDLELGPNGDDWTKLEAGVRERLLAGERLIVLGGDHAITYPVVRAHRDVLGEFSILHFDAHSDIYDDFEGNPHSHASPFARIMEEGAATRLVQVGIRTLNDHLREQSRRFGVEYVEMSEWERIHDVELEGDVYVSVDLDVLDPAFAPGVSHWEPGGASTRQVLEVIHSLLPSARRNRPLRVVGADVVELNPERDPGGMSAMVAARITRELAGVMLVP